MGEDTAMSLVGPPLNRSPVDAFRRRTPNIPPPLLLLSSPSLLVLRSRGAVAGSDDDEPEGDGGPLLVVPCGVDSESEDEGGGEIVVLPRRFFLSDWLSGGADRFMLPPASLLCRGDVEPSSPLLLWSSSAACFRRPKPLKAAGRVWLLRITLAPPTVLPPSECLSLGVNGSAAAHSAIALIHSFFVSAESMQMTTRSCFA